MPLMSIVCHTVSPQRIQEKVISWLNNISVRMKSTRDEQDCFVYYQSVFAIVDMYLDAPVAWSLVIHAYGTICQGVPKATVLHPTQGRDGLPSINTYIYDHTSLSPFGVSSNLGILSQLVFQSRILTSKCSPFYFTIIYYKVAWEETSFTRIVCFYETKTCLPALFIHISF